MTANNNTTSDTEYMNVAIKNGNPNSMHTTWDLLTAISDIEKSTHISGEVYIATASTDTYMVPLILFEGSEGSGVFNPTVLFEQSSRLWFILSRERTKKAVLDWGDCDYCSGDNQYVFNMTRSEDGILRSPVEVDEEDSKLKTSSVGHNYNSMCEECLESLLGVLYMCEEDIQSNLVAESL